MGSGCQLIDWWPAGPCRGLRRPAVIALFFVAKLGRKPLGVALSIVLIAIWTIVGGGWMKVVGLW